MAFTTGSPIVIFGTKWPSITSTWSTPAPPLSTARISSASREKSADRIDGAISITLPLTMRLTTQRTQRLCGGVGAVDGVRAGDGARFTFRLIRFEFSLSVNGMRLLFVVARFMVEFALALTFGLMLTLALGLFAFRFRLPFELLPLLAVLALALSDVLALLLAFAAVFALSSAAVASAASPSLATRAMSTATVCPAFTA